MDSLGYYPATICRTHRLTVAVSGPEGAILKAFEAIASHRVLVKLCEAVGALQFRPHWGKELVIGEAKAKALGVGISLAALGMKATLPSWDTWGRTIDTHGVLHWLGGESAADGRHSRRVAGYRVKLTAAITSSGQMNIMAKIRSSMGRSPVGTSQSSQGRQ
jgi:hypothetical protein